MNAEQQALITLIHSCTLNQQRIDELEAKAGLLAYQLDASNTENQRLREALAIYGRHTNTCQLADPYEEEAECTCGFENHRGEKTCP